jgi:hypothetical protein
MAIRFVQGGVLDEACQGGKGIQNAKRVIFKALRDRPAINFVCPFSFDTMCQTSYQRKPESRFFGNVLDLGFLWGDG